MQPFTQALLDPNFSFAIMDKLVIDFWQNNKCMQLSHHINAQGPQFTFPDGPPFMTGLPHYGHVAVGSIKSAIIFYMMQNGYQCNQRFGADCHGQPIKCELEKKYSREHLEQLTPRQYNDLCRSIVTQCRNDWEKAMMRIGRWVDFENGWKTMDKNYMESVWWAFQQTHRRGYATKGKRVMTYCPSCATCISSHETAPHQMTPATSAYVLFRLMDGSASLVVWTTTPWTLSSNYAICVNPTLIYVRVLHHETRMTYIVSEKFLPELYKFLKAPATSFTIQERVAGSTLQNTEYLPLYHRENRRYIVVTDDYVTNDTGTGLVHLAPSFGEDDYRVCLKHHIVTAAEQTFAPIDKNANFTRDDFKMCALMSLADASKTILNDLRERQLLVKIQNINHMVPICGRCSNPLIHKSIPSWMLDVPRIRSSMLAKNAVIDWLPEFVRVRFRNWLESSDEWSVSRRGLWGTPIPVWQSDDGTETVVIGSIDELAALCGVAASSIQDLHPDYIQSMCWVSPSGKTMRWCGDVFDCWFESGCVPFASMHYPFENVEQFESKYTAALICEGIDQTRGWFYTLLVLSTMLFDKAPFKTSIVCGLVLAQDGEKMSKSKGNYTPLNEVLDAYCGDAVRFFLLNSHLSRAGNILFKDSDVRDYVKELLHWSNLLKLLVTSYRGYQATQTNAAQTQSLDNTDAITSAIQDVNDDNETLIMLQWIMIMSNNFITNYNAKMKQYDLHGAAQVIISHLQALSDYINITKYRLKNATTMYESMCILYYLMLQLSVTAAPHLPFMSEFSYQVLMELAPESTAVTSSTAVSTAASTKKSVHHYRYNADDDAAASSSTDAVTINASRIQQLIKTMFDIISSCCNCRGGIRSMKYPIRSVYISHPDQNMLDELKAVTVIIKNTCNIATLQFTRDSSVYFNRCVTHSNTLGKKYRQHRTAAADVINKLLQHQVDGILAGEDVTFIVADTTYTVTKNDISITYSVKPLSNIPAHTKSFTFGEFTIIMDLTVDVESIQLGLHRELVSVCQRLRKENNCFPEHNIEIDFDLSRAPKVQNMLTKTSIQLQSTTLKFVQLDHSVACNAVQINVSPYDNECETIYYVFKQIK